MGSEPSISHPETLCACLQHPSPAYHSEIADRQRDSHNIPAIYRIRRIKILTADRETQLLFELAKVYFRRVLSDQAANIASISKQLLSLSPRSSTGEEGAWRHSGEMETHCGELSHCFVPHCN
ncbi:hypothetical protein VTI28DRAFT_7547 [Corynascus sepedonium]